RKVSFKMPPMDAARSQESRRTRALEEQKKRRAEKIDAVRMQLESFANLNINDDDADEDIDADDTEHIVREGISAFAPLLDVVPETSATIDVPTSPQASSRSRRRKKRNSADKKSRESRPNPKWADKCMYAELLEMSSDAAWALDALPSDLDTAWVAVAPVPRGKRCLAVTHQSSGIAGQVPNTTLRSRLLGKSLIPPFPSPLPPSTVLDCILDEHWRENGILHILDVLKWKGQDIADCETPFRFWWRDTRLAETCPCLAATTDFPTPDSSPSSFSSTSPLFAHPTSFVPVPYHPTTTLPTLLTDIIPAARSQRAIPFPVIHASDSYAITAARVPAPTLRIAHVQSDGLLLYVAEAMYESGTTPLSLWVPSNSFNPDEHSH
ncbi:hypothetical protein FISHEDRAFT_20428, partial [Fistulina hepatica ATCC 64428]